MKNVKRKTRKNRVLISTLIILIITIGTIWLFKYGSKSKNSTSNTTNTTLAEDQINYSPPTDQEKKSGDETKKTIVERESQQQNNNSSEVRQVTPIITNATPDNVSAYISGIFEEGGKCTAVFTQGQIKIIRDSVGFGNASYTQCAPINPNLPNSNKWLVVVTYSSQTSTGSSDSTEIK